MGAKARAQSAPARTGAPTEGALMPNAVARVLDGFAFLFVAAWGLVALFIIPDAERWKPRQK